MVENIICITFFNLFNNCGFKLCVNGTTCSFCNSNSSIDHLFIKNNQPFNNIHRYIHQNVIMYYYSTIIAALTTYFMKKQKKKYYR